jgi:hypothetical protein
VRAFVAHAHERRHGGIKGPLQLSHHAAELRPAAGRDGARAIREAGVALDRIVTGLRTDERADDGELVHHLRHAREEFADLDAIHIRADGLVRSGDLARCIWLQIKHVLMRRSADEIDQDDRLVRVADARLVLQRQQLRQRQAEGAQTADFDEVATRDAITEGAAFFGGSENLEHGRCGVGRRTSMELAPAFFRLL